MKKHTDQLAQILIRAVKTGETLRIQGALESTVMGKGEQGDARAIQAINSLLGDRFLYRIAERRVKIIEMILEKASPNISFSVTEETQCPLFLAIKEKLCEAIPTLLGAGFTLKDTPEHRQAVGRSIGDGRWPYPTQLNTSLGSDYDALVTLNKYWVLNHLEHPHTDEILALEMEADVMGAAMGKVLGDACSQPGGISSLEKRPHAQATLLKLFKMGWIDTPTVYKASADAPDQRKTQINRILTYLEQISLEQQTAETTTKVKRSMRL